MSSEERDNFLSGGEYILCVPIDDSKEKYLLLSKEGILNIFDPEKKRVILRKRISPYKVLKATYFNNLLFFVDRNNKLNIFLIPSLILLIEAALKLILEREYIEVVDITYLKNGTLIILTSKDLILYDSNDFVTIDLPPYLHNSYIFSVDGHSSLELITRQLEVYKVFFRLEEVDFRNVKFFNSEDSVKKGVYRNRVGKYKGVVFSEPALRSVVVVNGRKDRITRFGIIRDEYAKVFYFDPEEDLFILGSESGKIYYSGLRKREFKSVKFTSSSISLICKSKDGYYVFDKGGGLNEFFLEKKEASHINIFKSNSLSKLALTPDYNGEGYLLVRERAKDSYLFNYKTGKKIATFHDPLLSNNLSEAIVDSERNKIYIFSPDNFIYAYDFSGKREKLKHYGFPQPYVIKKLKNDYIIGTEGGFFRVLSENLQPKYFSNKLSKSSILMMENFNISGTDYITFTTSGGEQILYKFLENSRVFNIKLNRTDVLSNSIVIGDFPSYFVFAARDKIIVYNIENRGDKIEIEITDKVEISLFFKLSSFGDHELGIVDVSGNIYKIPLSEITNEFNRIKLKEWLVFMFDVEMDDTSLKVAGDDIIVSDIFGEIHILNYKSFDEAMVNIKETALATVEPVPGIMVISTKIGDLLIVDLKSGNIKKEKIIDWILKFERINDGTYFSISYRGIFYNIFSGSKSVDYSKLESVSEKNVIDFLYDSENKIYYYLDTDYSLYTAHLNSPYKVKRMVKEKFKGSRILKYKNYIITANQDMKTLLEPVLIFFDIDTGILGFSNLNSLLNEFAEVDSRLDILKEEEDYSEVINSGYSLTLFRNAKLLKIDNIRPSKGDALIVDLDEEINNESFIGILSLKGVPLPVIYLDLFIRSQKYNFYISDLKDDIMIIMGRNEGRLSLSLIFYLREEEDGIRLELLNFFIEENVLDSFLWQDKIVFVYENGLIVQKVLFGSIYKKVGYGREKALLARNLDEHFFVSYENYLFIQKFEVFNKKKLNDKNSTKK